MHDQCRILISMIEKSFAYKRQNEDELVMEKVINDDNVNINHIVVAPGKAVPTHASNSHVHQIIIRGVLSLSLEDGPFTEYSAGTIVAVPFNQKMVIQNRGNETLEFFVVKAPNPKNMPPTKNVNA